MSSSFTFPTSTSLSSCIFPVFPSQTPSLIAGPISPISLNTTLLIGALNAKHTSNASITYSQLTTPTPWPILLAGYLVSFAISLYGTISSNRDAWSVGIQPASTFHVAFSTFIAIYQIIRSLLALVTVSKAVHGTSGRFLSPTAITALMLSTINNVFDINVPNLVRALGSLAVLADLITLNTLMVVEIFLDKPEYYAKWLLVNGNCPKVLGGLSDFEGATCPSQMFYVGCAVDALASEDYRNATLQMGFHDAVTPDNAGKKNLIVAEESVLGMLAASICGLFSLAGLGGAFIFFKALILTLGHFLSRPFALDRDDVWAEMKATVCTFATIAIAVYVVIAFALHYVTETRDNPLVVQDSFGGISEVVGRGYGYGNGSFVGDGVDGVSWTDFYVVSPPSDRLGFLEYWWDNEDAKAWEWISLA